MNSISTQEHELLKIEYSKKIIVEMAYESAKFDLQNNNVDNDSLIIAGLLPNPFGLEAACEVLSYNHSIYNNAYIEGLKKYFPNSVYELKIKKQKHTSQKNSSHPKI
jgi:hypothetical protein